MWDISRSYSCKLYRMDPEARAIKSIGFSKISCAVTLASGISKTDIHG